MSVRRTKYLPSLSSSPGSVVGTPVDDADAVGLSVSLELGSALSLGERTEVVVGAAPSVPPFPRT
jgi:hypothetical protein